MLLQSLLCDFGPRNSWWPSSLLSSKYSNHTALDLPYFSSRISSKGPNPQKHSKFLGLELKTFREDKIQNSNFTWKVNKDACNKKKNGGKLKVKKKKSKGNLLKK